VVAGWYETSNNVVVLHVPDEEELLALADAAVYGGVGVWVFSEPDLGGAHTALALAPGEAASKLCSTLPLAFREAVV